MPTVGIWGIEQLAIIILFFLPLFFVKVWIYLFWAGWLFGVEGGSELGGISFLFAPCGSAG